MPGFGEVQGQLRLGGGSDSGDLSGGELVRRAGEAGGELLLAKIEAREKLMEFKREVRMCVRGW